MKTNTPKMKKLFGKKNQKLGLKKIKEDFSGLPKDDEEDLSKLDDESSDFDTTPDETEQDLDLSDETDPTDDDVVAGDEDMDASDDVDSLGVDGAEGGDEVGDEGKDLLKQMIMAIIDGDEEAATDALHQYMTSTTKDMLDDDGDMDSDDLGGEPGEDELGSDDDLGGEPGEEDLGGESEFGADEDELDGQVKEGKTWKDSKKNKMAPKGKVCKVCKKSPCKCC